MAELYDASDEVEDDIWDDYEPEPDEECLCGYIDSWCELCGYHGHVCPLETEE